MKNVILYLFFIATPFSQLFGQDIAVLEKEFSELGTELTVELHTKEASSYKFLELKRITAHQLVKNYKNTNSPILKKLFRYLGGYWLKVCEHTELDYLNSDLVKKKKLDRFFFLRKVIAMRKGGVK